LNLIKKKRRAKVINYAEEKLFLPIIPIALNAVIEKDLNIERKL